MKKILKRIFNPDSKKMIPNEQDIMDYLILKGAMEVVGVDLEDGSFLYCFTPKIKEVMPELYEEHLRSLNAETLALWEKGFIDIDFFAEDPLISLSNKSFDLYEVNKLTKQEKSLIDEIKRLSF